MIRTRGITHVNLAVRDLDRSLRFYSTLIGMEEVYRVEPNAVFLRTPGTGDLLALELDPQDAQRVGDNGGIDHWGFIVEDPKDLDTQKIQVEVEAAGRKFIKREVFLDGAIPGIYVSDPDGYLIQLFFDPTQSTT